MASPETELRNRYASRGILAGASHFGDLWARDALFACRGALALGTPRDVAAVAATLSTLAAHRRHDGHVPIRVGGYHQVLRYLHLPAGEGARHGEDKRGHDALDGNALWLIVADELARTRPDLVDREAARAIADWLVRSSRRDLLASRGYDDWEDSLRVIGPRLYVNVLLASALDAAARLLRDRSLATRAARTRARILRWWNGTYFSDGPRRNVCMTAGNLLAITTGVASRAQSRIILAHLATRTSVCPPGGLFTPSFRDTYAAFFAIGLSDYHARMEWGWLAPLEAMAYVMIGERAEARRRLDAYRRLRDTYGTTHEVYLGDRPVRRLVYRSETAFAWANGMYVLAERGSR
jgi:glycogen debranching enzyme